MPMKLTYTETRPSTSVPFVDIDQETAEYINQNYNTYMTGHMQFTFSDDNLTRTSVVFWDDDVRFQDYANDQKIASAALTKQHKCEELGITRDFNMVHVNSNIIL